METRVFCDNFTEFCNKRINPVHSICFCNVRNSFNGCCSNGRNPIFKVIKDERLQVLDKKLIVLNKIGAYLSLNC